MKKQATKCPLGRKTGGIKVGSNDSVVAIDRAMRFYYGEFEDDYHLAQMVKDFVADSPWILSVVERALESEKPGPAFGPINPSDLGINPKDLETLDRLRPNCWEIRRERITSGLKIMVALATEMNGGKANILGRLKRCASKTAHGEFQPVDEMRSLISQFKSEIEELELTAAGVRDWLKKRDVRQSMRSVQDAMKELGIRRPGRGRPKKREF